VVSETPQNELDVPADFTVRLERVFQGPMDLLLHLVREQEVEIHEIQISRIVDGYLAYLDSLESLDIEYAADFLLMAAILMSIKSRSLLPREELDLEDELDPKDELIQRLIEYRRFKKAADGLEEALLVRTRMLERGWRSELDDRAPEREFDLGELTPWDLLAVYSRLMRETLADRPHHVDADPRPLRFYVDQVVTRLRETPQLGLRGVIEAMGDVPIREALVGSFCALLELVKLQLIEVRQESPRADIEIAIAPEHQDDLEAVVQASLVELDAAEAMEASRRAAVEASGPKSGPPA